MNTWFSTPTQLENIVTGVKRYYTSPYALEFISGKVFEIIVADAHNTKPTNTQDFADVICGDYAVQCKAGRDNKDMIWKRISLPDELVRESLHSDSISNDLGKLLLDRVNARASDSLAKYNVTKLAYSRLITHKNKLFTYFEKSLNNPIFDRDMFQWKWSTPQKRKDKPALHGFWRSVLVFSWQGLSGEQFRFNAEHLWWPKEDQRITFSIPHEWCELDI